MAMVKSTQSSFGEERREHRRRQIPESHGRDQEHQAKKQNDPADVDEPTQVSLVARLGQIGWVARGCAGVRAEQRWRAA